MEQLQRSGQRPAPVISVILNFYDPRGHAEHVVTWTRNQTLPAERFEVIAVTTSQRAALAADIRALLRPQDQVLCVDTDEPFDLYAPAVRIARAPWLFFSEDHCLARPQCLEAVARFMERGDYAGGSIGWGHLNHNAIGVMEQRTSERDVGTWSAPDHWNKLRIRGFVLSREAYEGVGGIDGRYANFGEALLSARLHAAGYRLGAIDEEGVVHINTSHFAELFHNVWQYSWNECLYCDEQPGEFCDRYFGPASDFVRELRHEGGTARWLRAAAVQVVRRELGARNWHGGIGLAQAWWAARKRTWAARWRRIAAYRNLYAARTRFAFWRFDEERRFRAFADYWLRGVECARADYAAQARLTEAAPNPPWTFAGLDVPAVDAAGCHPVERHRGLTFLWTQPAAALWLEVPRGACRLTLDTAGLRGPDCGFPLGIFWNDYLLPEDAVKRANGRISFDVRPEWFVDGSPQRLTLVAAPLRAPEDPRALGVPLHSIEIEAQRSTLARCA